MVLAGLSRIVLVDKPMPSVLKHAEVLVRMRSVGICGSDIHYFREGRIGSQIVQYPFTIGHEGSGIIEKTGSEVKGLNIGDRVAIDPAMPCYKCDQCRVGRFHTCRNMRFLGCPGQAEGCLSEYLLMPESSCHRLPDNVTFDQAALAEPLSIGLYAVTLASSVAGKAIVILGSGPIGVSVMLAARAQGAGIIYMTDKIEDRLRLARLMGADWTGNPDSTDIVNAIQTEGPAQIDLIFECCGKQEAADKAVNLLAPGGKLMIVGIPSFPRWTFNVEDLRRKEIAIQNVRRQNETLAETIDMIASGKLCGDKMKTHDFTLDETEKAFNLVANYADGVMKAVIHI
jgi:L-iditol 2-dehydrogenase